MLRNKNGSKVKNPRPIDKTTWDSSRLLVLKVGQRLADLNKPISGYTLYNLIEEQYSRHKFYQLFDVQEQFLHENEFSLNTIESMDDSTFKKVFHHKSKALNKRQKANLKLLYPDFKLELSELESQKIAEWTEIPKFGKTYVSEVIPCDNRDFELETSDPIETSYWALEMYNDDSVKILEQSFHDNLSHGPTILFYPNGAKEHEELYYYGERNGTSRSWHSNGAMESEGFWVEGKSVGFWTYYDEDGQVVSKIHGEDVLQGDLRMQGKKAFIKQYELIEST